MGRAPPAGEEAHAMTADPRPVPAADPAPAAGALAALRRLWPTSLPDAVFYPLVTAVAAGFVFLALDPFADRPPSGPVSAGGRNAGDVEVAGEELLRFRVGSAAGLDLQETADGASLRITRLAEQVYDDPRSGPHLVLAEDLEVAFADARVEVTIEARSEGDFAADAFEARYMARADAASPWETFPLTREFAPYTFVYDPPGHEGALGYDYLGVRPVAPDKRRTVDVRSVRFRLVEKTG
jgi:hypothetical protein